MGENFIERLQLFMENKGINDNQMTVAAGLSVGLLGKLKKSGKGMNSSNIEKILHTYSELNPEWLLTGNGPMLKQASEAPVAPAAPAKDSLESRKMPDDVEGGLPLIPMDAIAGFPAFDTNGIVLADCDRYRIPEFEDKGAQFVIRVSGDSMLPTFHNGDILACRKIKEVLFFQWGEAYVLDTSQGPLLKRLQPIEGDDECVRCVSDNATNYPPFAIPKSDIRNVSTIIGLIRLM